MPREILLYGDIGSYSAPDVITQMNDAGSSDVVLRVNSNGGEVRYGWGILSKAKELKGKKLFKNDGEANSLAAILFCYNDDNEAIDTATFMFHRASYGEWYEGSEYFTEADRSLLIVMNKSLREALEAKVDVKKFEKSIDTTLDVLFSLNGRKEVTLNADQALECGLINRIIQLTPALKSNIEANSVKITALYSGHKIAANTPSPIITTMTAEEIKSKFPEAYRSIYAKGLKRGTEKEFDRAGSIFAYKDADPQGVIEAFKSGKPATETQKAEWGIKAASAMMEKKIEDGNTPPLPVPAAAATATSKEAADKADFKKELFAQLNLKATA